MRGRSFWRGGAAVCSYFFHPHWGAALLSRDSVRTGLVAAAVGVYAGAIAGQSTFNTAVSNKSATRPANQANLPISVQTETVKSSVDPTSSDNPGAKRAEAQMSVGGQSSSDQPRCDVESCERHYRSFRASDCTYQPYGGPRQYCTR